MPPPMIGIGARSATALITPQHPELVLFKTWPTSTTAFGTRSARADLIERFTQSGASDQAGPQDSARSAFFRPQGGSLIMVKPLIIGSDNHTMNLEFWLWEEVYREGPNYEKVKQWSPQFLCEVTATACAKVGLGDLDGVNATPIPAVARYCDTLAFPTSQAADDAALPPLQTRFMQTATAGDTIARIAIDYVGAPYIECRLKLGQANTSGNIAIKTV